MSLATSPDNSYYIISTRRHETGSILHLRNGMRYRRNSNGYPDIFRHAKFTKVTGDIVRQVLLHYFNMADTKPEVDCISETGWAINEIPTASPSFSATHNSPMLLATSPYISYYPIPTSRRSYNNELQSVICEIPTSSSSCFQVGRMLMTLA